MKTLSLIVIVLALQAAGPEPVQARGNSIEGRGNVPSGTVPPGDVLRPDHLGRTTGDLERIIHFHFFIELMERVSQ